MVSKPVASHLEGDDPVFRSSYAYDISIRKSFDYGQNSLVQRVVNRLWDDADLARRLSNMYAGPGFPSRSFPTSVTECSKPLHIPHPRSSSNDIDITRLNSTVRINMFGTGSLRPSTMEKEKIDDRHSNRCEALYELPSFINHSCIASAHRYFFGDIIVVRSGCAMKAGEEVTIRYFGEDEDDPDPVNGIKSQRVWGFLCSCKLCTAKGIDGPEVVEKCKALTNQVTAVPEPTIKHAMSTLSQLEAIYSQPHWKDVPCKASLSSVHESMHVAFQASMSRPTAYEPAWASIEHVVKAQEADGLHISLPQKGRRRSKMGKQTRNSSDITIDLEVTPSRGFTSHVLGTFAVSHVCLSNFDIVF